MIVLDTDVITHLRKRNSLGVLIEAWLNGSPDRQVRITVVTAYEIMNGVVSLVEKRKKDRGNLIPGFFLLEESIKYLATWKDQILSYDFDSERIYRGFPPRLRQELKNDARIAAVALLHRASVWTCNVSDFSRVPGFLVFDARTGSRVS